MKTELRFIFVFFCVINFSQSWADSFSNLVQGVNKISMGSGTPGPVWPYTEDWRGIAGSSSTSSYSIFSCAREYGLGRVIANGHDGAFGDIYSEDNGIYTENVFNWLCEGNPKTIVYLTGCWQCISNGSDLYNFLTLKGFSISSISVPITQEKLSGYSCLFVGGMWNHSFTADEVSFVEEFVTNGGGLNLCGLGWSWMIYHPDKTIEDYPMMQLAQPYQVRWLDGYLTSEFDLFYPSLNSYTLAGAMNTILDIHLSHPSDLPSILQSDTNLRNSYLLAHSILRIPLNFPLGNSSRDDVYHFYKQLINDYPNYLQKDALFDAGQYPCFVQAREQIYTTLVECKDLTSGIKDEVSAAINLNGWYKRIWDDHTIFLLDNNGLEDSQKQFIYAYKSLIPIGLDNLTFISVRDFLGSPWYGLSLGSSASNQPWRGSVNIFGLPIGPYIENSFPADEEPCFVNIFCGCLAHEHNHIVDAFTVGNDPSFKDRKYSLIEQAAGTDIVFQDHSVGYGVNWDETKARFLLLGYWDGVSDHWDQAWSNYWSTGPGLINNENWLRNNLKYMCEAPQESFATLANQYFTNGRLMLDLSIRRWNRGIMTCINQFLYFLDVYSQETDLSYIYMIDTNGVIIRNPVIISRNSDGFIQQIEFDEKIYSFQLDVNGDVTFIEGPTCQYGVLSDINYDCLSNLGDFAIIIEYWLETNCGDCYGADLTGDHSVDFNDLLVWVDDWLWDIDGNYADINHDGIVNLQDFRILSHNWLKTRIGLLGDIGGANGKEADMKVNQYDLSLFFEQWLIPTLD